MSYESFLSQAEVDELLATVSGDEPKSGDTPQTPSLDGVRAYDLSSTDRVVRRRMQTLELINERFARRLRHVFLNFMRRNADISVGQIQVLKYAEFERNLPVPSNLNMVKLNPLRGVALFAFDPMLVFLIIESMFGGQARSNTRVEGRDFTATEQRIIRRLLDHTLACYTQAWEGIYPLEYAYVRSEMHTKFASVTSAHEVVVVTPIRIEFGSMGGSLNVCLPYSMIEPIRGLLTNPYQESGESSADSRWSKQMSNQIRQAQVELVAQFAELNLSLGDLMRLEKGSIIPFELRESITAFVNGVPALKCGYGTSNKHYALEVQEHLQAPSFDYLSENQDV
ncbi:flagellar motor switch protein FliM [Bordetella sp. 15P40C-2]|uniref:flagellar motor switch protein FliM n=1 Tax=Bordetella sp. 15P40C-2 TaxID=2572246 RepID=UPI00132BF826|nr:flagellar motor switch protein FliM [Bordetella sp. 15P40C-2]MVW69960.1 flagellar motor switch protein FliM [Bordetella sp. 15P40C-2]